MCCNDFWKKITVFSITLLIGFFAAEFFKFEEPMNIKLSVPMIEEVDDLSLQKSSPTLPQIKRKNCVPADSTLKYKYLKDGVEIEISKTNDVSDLEKTKKSADKSDKLKKRIEEIKKVMITRQYHNVRPQNLVYLEKCSEYGESMKGIPILPIDK